MRKTQLTAPNDLIKLSPVGVAIDKPINISTPYGVDLVVADLGTNNGQGSYTPVQLKGGANLSIEYSQAEKTLTLDTKFRDAYTVISVEGPVTADVSMSRNVLAVTSSSNPSNTLILDVGAVSDITTLYGETYHVAVSGTSTVPMNIQLIYQTSGAPTIDIPLNFYAGGIEGSAIKQDNGTDIGLVIMPDPKGGIGDASALLLMSGQPVIVTVA